FTVLKTLDEQLANYKLHNSRMTGRGLFDVLAEWPTAVHVLEDCESMLRDPNAANVLRSAVWGPRDPATGLMVRTITWNVNKARLEVAFSGGIIIVANRAMDDLPELRALATRLNPLLLPVTFEETSALMRRIALDGHRNGEFTLPPEQCGEVAEFLIGQY